MATKQLKIGHTETAITVYCIITRDADGYYLQSVDDSFGAVVSYPSMTEDATRKGLYIKSSAPAWSDGGYTVLAYKQSGGSPVPASDTVIGQGAMYVLDDAEVVLNDSLSTVTAKTDLIPVDPATETNVNANETKIDIIDTNVDTLITRVSGAVALDSTVAKEATLSTHDTYIKALLESATYGLAALKTLIDAIDTSTELAARFTEIKGATWSNETLESIKAAIDLIDTATGITAEDVWTYVTRNLTPPVVDISDLPGINHDTGGTDILRYMYSGSGIGNAYILAYLKTDYDAGNTSSSYIKGAARTTADGRWYAPIYVVSGTYTIVFTKTGEYGPDTVEVTV